MPAVDLMEHLVNVIFPFEADPNNVAPTMPRMDLPSRGDVSGTLGTATTNTTTIDSIIEENKMQQSNNKLWIHCAISQIFIKNFNQH